MKKLLLIATTILLSSSLTYSQFKVKGIVRSAEDSSPLPGVNVVIKGTTKGTITDMDGNFRIEVDTGSVLVFSFIGFATQEILVEANSDLAIGLPTDISIQIDLENGIMCFFPGYCQYQRIGFSSGIKHNPVGFHYENMMPYLFDLPVFLQSGLLWRIPHRGNKYFNTFFRKYNIPVGLPIRLGIAGRYMHIENNRMYMKQASVSGDLEYRGYVVGTGYSHLRYDNPEASGTKEGLLLKANKRFFGQLVVGFSAVRWSDFWQYAFSLEESPRNLPLTFAVRWEDTPHWNELGISVLYRIGWIGGFMD